MSTFSAQNAPPMTADLDGWSFDPDMRSYAPQATSYMQDNSDDFGFDPPTADASMPSIETYYSPRTFDSVEGSGSWPGIQADHRSKASLQQNSDEPVTLKKAPFAASALSRHGQLTPPRSNSATSSASARASAEEEALPSRRKRNLKVEIKSEESPTAEAPTTTRKRKPSRKSATATATQPVINPEDDKRKMSLEKNRLAAAKCRVNKKERTDQLQRDSHDKAVENSFLKQTIMQMKEEVQQLQTILMSHSSSDQCKSADSIHEALGAAGSESLSDQVAMSQFQLMQTRPRDTNMRQLDHDQSMHGDYFQSREAPALPDFNMSEFEVRTPMLD